MVGVLRQATGVRPEGDWCTSLSVHLIAGPQRAEAVGGGERVQSVAADKAVNDAGQSVAQSNRCAFDLETHTKVPSYSGRTTSGSVQEPVQRPVERFCNSILWLSLLTSLTGESMPAPELPTIMVSVSWRPWLVIIHQVHHARKIRCACR